jgi:hypothetical protein
MLPAVRATRILAPAALRRSITPERLLVKVELPTTGRLQRRRNRICARHPAQTWATRRTGRRTQVRVVGPRKAMQVIVAVRRKASATTVRRIARTSRPRPGASRIGRPGHVREQVFRLRRDPLVRATTAEAAARRTRTRTARTHRRRNLREAVERRRTRRILLTVGARIARPRVLIPRQAAATLRRAEPIRRLRVLIQRHPGHTLHPAVVMAAGVDTAEGAPAAAEVVAAVLGAVPAVAEAEARAAEVAVAALMVEARTAAFKLTS